MSRVKKSGLDKGSLPRPQQVRIEPQRLLVENAVTYRLAGSRGLRLLGRTRGGCKRPVGEFFPPPQDIQRTLGAGATRDDAPNVPPQSPLASLILYVVTEWGPGPRIAKAKNKGGLPRPSSGAFSMMFNPE